MVFSRKAQQRMAQWNLSSSDIAYVIAYGCFFNAPTVMICFLRRCDIPLSDLANGRQAQLEGTAVVLNKDGSIVITVWRDRGSGLQQLRRKQDFKFTSSPEKIVQKEITYEQ
jgi:hypothetical protein